MVDVDETGKVTFRFRASGLAQAFVVGDFCHWQTDHLPMRKVSDNEWVLMLRLPPGCYEFRYYADGQWFTDYAAFGVHLNAYKQYNSVLRIPRVRPTAQRQTVRLRRSAHSAWAATG